MSRRVANALLSIVAFGENTTIHLSGKRHFALFSKYCKIISLITKWKEFHCSVRQRFKVNAYSNCIRTDLLGLIRAGYQRFAHPWNVLWSILIIMLNFTLRVIEDLTGIKQYPIRIRGRYMSRSEPLYSISY